VLGVELCHDAKCNGGSCNEAKSALESRDVPRCIGLLANANVDGKGSIGLPFFGLVCDSDVGVNQMMLDMCKGAAIMGSGADLNAGLLSKHVNAEECLVGATAGELNKEDAGGSDLSQYVEDNQPRSLEKGEAFVSCFQLMNAVPIDLV